LAGCCCSKADLVLLLGQDLEWSLLTGICYLEVIVNTGLTVYEMKLQQIFRKKHKPGIKILPFV
jgi:hypothetical protein